MALNIKKTVTAGGLSRMGCYVQLVPHFVTGTPVVPMDRNIWKDRTDYEANPTQGTIRALDEIPQSFNIDTTTAPADCQGATVIAKMLYWMNTQAKAKLLILNPSWIDGDIEIVDL